MKYKEKVLRKRLFRQSLVTLQEFACTEPQLPLNNRRAIVASIYFGSCSSKPNKDAKPQTFHALNYQFTQQGLIRSCLDKMISFPDEDQKLKKAICTISSLGAWAKGNPNLTQDIFEDFVSQILPEDENWRRKIKLSNRRISDWLLDSPNTFYKKIHTR